MPATDLRRRVALLLSSAALACAGNPAPAGWLAPALEAQADRYGAWVVVAQTHGGPDVEGEFLALEYDSVFVLSMDGHLRTVPVHDGLRGRIAFYDARWGQLAVWTGVGALSTISNGLLAGVTFPLWILGGSLATGGQSRAPLRVVDSPDALAPLRMYARFPAGLPQNLPRTLPPKRRY